MEESVHMIYGEIAEKLISIHFQFSFEDMHLNFPLLIYLTTNNNI